MAKGDYSRYLTIAGDGRIWGKKVSRRALLKAALASGALVAIPGVIACGDDEAGNGLTPTATGAASPTPGATMTPSGPTGSASIGVNLSVSSLDPLQSRGSRDAQIYRLIYGNLVRIDENTEVHPDLAESWEIVDPMTWLFSLRSGVAFHDGTQFDADAARIHLDRARDPETGSTQSGDLANVQEVQAPDPSTLQLLLSTPTPYLLNSLFNRAGMMYSPAAVDQYGDDTGSHAVGTGPYQVTDFRPDDRVVTSAFDEYWDTSIPKIAEWTTRYFPDYTIGVQSLQAGEIDVLYQIDAIQADQLRSADGVTIIEAEDRLVGRFGMNQFQPPFDNRNLREAMRYAISAEDVINVGLRGVGTPGELTFGWPWSWWGDDDAPRVPERDPQRVQQLLEAAGVPNGFSFQLMHFRDDEVIEVIRQNLADLGITMEIDKVDVATYASRNRGDTLDYQAKYATAGVAGILDPGLYVRRYLWSGAAFNNAVHNDTIDELMLEAEALEDRDERDPIYQQIDDIYYNEEITEVPIFRTSQFSAVRDDMNGIIAHPDETLVLTEAFREE